MNKAQTSFEYMITTGFVLIIVVVIFGIAILNSSQAIMTRQISESLDNLVQTSDLVYALGKGNSLFTDIIWSSEVTGISLIHKCHTSAEKTGCPATAIECTAEGTNIRGCCDNKPQCLKQSAIKLTFNYFGNSQELVYASRAKIYSVAEIDPASNQIKNAKYQVRVSTTTKTFDTAPLTPITFIELKRT